MSETVDLDKYRALAAAYQDEPTTYGLMAKRWLATIERAETLETELRAAGNRIMDQYERAETLAAENTTLRESLFGEWLSNHFEHCTRWDGIGDCPNVLGCQWPKPAALAEHPQAAPHE